jgi:hypothetical protein
MKIRSRLDTLLPYSRNWPSHEHRLRDTHRGLATSMCCQSTAARVVSHHLGGSGSSSARGILHPCRTGFTSFRVRYKALSDLGSTPSTGDSVAGPSRTTPILPVPLGTTPLAVGSMYLTSRRHNFRRSRPPGPMDAAPSSRSRSCGVDAQGRAMSLSPMCVHPTKNATPSQHRCITASPYPLAVSYRRIASLP